MLNKVSYPKDDLAKTYVDDEAEEEDDSDHDLMRFQESEDDDSDDSDGNEVLDDLIMTGYEEAPVEHEKRNQLHQKWLEQQDANETDNVLQRLNCGQIRREPSIIDDEDDNVDTDDEDSADEMIEDQIPANLVRKNSKKAKQMMAQMFTDETDVYVSSEDEETERSLIREHLLHQKVCSFLSYSWSWTWFRVFYVTPIVSIYDTLSCRHLVNHVEFSMECNTIKSMCINC